LLQLQLARSERSPCAGILSLQHGCFSPSWLCVLRSARTLLALGDFCEHSSQPVMHITPLKLQAIDNALHRVEVLSQLFYLPFLVEEVAKHGKMARKDLLSSLYTLERSRSTAGPRCTNIA